MPRQTAMIENKPYEIDTDFLNCFATASQAFSLFVNLRAESNFLPACFSTCVLTLRANLNSERMRLT